MYEESIMSNKLPSGCCSIIRLTLCLCLVYYTSPLVAKGKDTGEAITIEADRATYDEKKGETVYEGGVHAVQGSLTMDSDVMTVYQSGSTNKIIATGKPVRLKQTPDGGGEDMHGTGQKAEYYPDTGILILLDHAIVWQGGDSTESDRIEYDSRRNLVKAGDLSSGKSRVHVKLLPKNTTPPPRP